MAKMSSLRLILASLAYHWPVHLAVGLGVAAGTAVLTGALLVGDSMRGSLRALTLERLGRIDEVLLAEQFFRMRLAEELTRRPGFAQHFTAAVPAILLRASLENPDAAPPPRANRVNLIGCTGQFWELFPGQAPPRINQRQIVLNEPLAERLEVRVGDEVVLRVPRITSIPADSSLGRKKETVRSYRLVVCRILAAEGAGRFSLQPNQQVPWNAYVPLQWLAQRLEQPERANTILVAGRQIEDPPPPDAEKSLEHMLRPGLTDYGLRVEPTNRGYVNIVSDRMLLDPAAEKGILKALAQDRLTVQPALTYLANTMGCRGREIPYSTITAVDWAFPPPLGPLVTAEGKPIAPLADGEIVLNRWAADDLQARPGDQIRVRYFDPDAAEGQVREHEAEFRLVAIAELTGAAADPAFTPQVAGLTDQASIADWDPPFPFDAKRIRKQDEQYWQAHRATPKAFVALSEGRRRWASRFGSTTSLRVAAPARTLPAAELARLIAQTLEAGLLRPAELGFAFQPVKRQGLEASAGTTPFSLLFLGFSFFLIAAAVLLVAVLFRLGIEGRASQVGVLLAVGCRRAQVFRLFAGEGLLVAGLAGLIGVAAGVGYGALMLAGLQTWWLAAVVTPFLRLHVAPESLVIGYVSGVVTAFAAIAVSVRSIGRLTVRRLLAGVTEEEPYAPQLPKRRAAWRSMVAWLLLVVALSLGLVAPRLGEEARAGAFFAAGALVLVASLTALSQRLRRQATGPAIVAGRGNLTRMALRNAARNPMRSLLTIGALAAALFLIISVSAFRIDPASQQPRLDSGNGGFALLAESDQPISYDPNTPAGQSELGFSPQDAASLKDARVFSFRVKPGEDASCLNLYRPRQPRILGAPDSFLRRGGFVFSASQTGGQPRARNPWLLLSQAPSSDPDGVPRLAAIVDEATAKYSLHLWQGVGQTLEVTDSRGRPRRLEIVALLRNSIFQGDVLISEAALRRYFPEVNGYRFFLVEAPPSKHAHVQSALERTLGAYGLDAQRPVERLAALMAVQNTYLSTFQTLGGLGLILGTFGLAAVEVRNVAERRAELALLRALGIGRAALARMVMLETGVLLLAGVGSGLVAALVAVLPHYNTGAASVPWASLSLTVLVVLGAGWLAGLAAVRSVLGAPLLEGLRHE